MTPEALVRAFAIAVGIMSATVIARDGFNLATHPYLSNTIDVYENWLDHVPLVGVDTLLKGVFTKLRERFAIDLQLLPHWKHVFVLMWLIFASYAWAGRSAYILHAAAFAWASGLFCALAGGALTGTVPLSHASILMWPLVSLAAFAGLQSLYWLTFGGIRFDDLDGSFLTKTIGSMGIDVLLVLGGTIATTSLAYVLR